MEVRSEQRDYGQRCQLILSAWYEAHMCRSWCLMQGETCIIAVEAVNIYLQRTLKFPVCSSQRRPVGFDLG